MLIVLTKIPLKKKTKKFIVLDLVASRGLHANCKRATSLKGNKMDFEFQIS